MPLLDEMGKAPPKTNGPPALVEVNGAKGLDGANIGIDRPKGEAAKGAAQLDAAAAKRIPPKGAAKRIPKPVPDGWPKPGAGAGAKGAFGCPKPPIEATG